MTTGSIDLMYCWTDSLKNDWHIALIFSIACWKKCIWIKKIQHGNIYGLGL
jgi:hypothetical protein